MQEAIANATSRRSCNLGFVSLTKTLEAFGLLLTIHGQAHTWLGRRQPEGFKEKSVSVKGGAVYAVGRVLVSWGHET
jgi:hypothetical protein